MKYEVKELKHEYYKKAIFEFFKEASIGDIVGFGGACFVEKISEDQFKACFSWYGLKENEIYDLSYISYEYSTSTCFREKVVTDKEYIQKVKYIDKTFKDSKIGTVVRITDNDNKYTDMVVKVSLFECAIPSGHKMTIKNNLFLSDTYNVSIHSFEFINYSE